MTDARAGQHALVLAAGEGRRFGGGKLLAEWKGAPLVQAAVRIALAAPVERVTVVVGHQASALRRALAPLASLRLCIVENDGWREGIASSLRTGVSALPSDARLAFIYLGDMPLVPHDMATRLLAALKADDCAATVIHPDGPGHPVLIRSVLFEQCLRLTGDSGLRSLLRAREVRRVADSRFGVRFDVDVRHQLIGEPE